MNPTRTKTLALHIKSAGDPSADQLAAIRRYTLADLPAEKLYVRTFVVERDLAGLAVAFHGRPADSLAGTVACPVP